MGKTKKKKTRNSKSFKKNRSLLSFSFSEGNVRVKKNLDNKSISMIAKDLGMKRSAIIKSLITEVEKQLFLLRDAYLNELRFEKERNKVA